MSSRFYKLSYFTNKKPVNAVINLYAISRIEHCENVVRILFNTSLSEYNVPQYLELTTTTETESEEIYKGIENAMNPINQSDETKLA